MAISGIQAFSRVAMHDIGVIGAGAAGVAATINMRYEGMDVALFEKRKDGGGGFTHTPLIYNLPGFPRGISGAELSRRSIEQVQALGGSFYPNTRITRIEKRGTDFFLFDQAAKEYRVSKVILASGVQYRKLNVLNAQRMEGKGLYYEVEDSIINTVRRECPPLTIYRAGNSGGQAALFYNELGARDSLIFRGDDLTKSMSQYLIERNHQKGTTVIPQTVITELKGEHSLSSIRIKHVVDGSESDIAMKYVFAMIGGYPCQLPQIDCDRLALDRRGYILTHPEKGSYATSIEGIYAAGDITAVGAGRILLAQAAGVTASNEAMRTLPSSAPER